MPRTRRKRTSGAAATAPGGPQSSSLSALYRAKRRGGGTATAHRKRAPPRYSVDGSTPYTSVELHSNPNLLSLEFGNRDDLGDKIPAKSSDSIHAAALKYLIPNFKNVKPRQWSLETIDHKGMKLSRWIPLKTSPSTELKRTIDDAIRYSVDKYTRNQKRAKRYSGAAVTRRYLREAEETDENYPSPLPPDTSTQTAHAAPVPDQAASSMQEEKDYSAEMYNRYRGEETGIVNNSERDVAPTPTTSAAEESVSAADESASAASTAAEDEEGSEGESSSTSEANEQQPTSSRSVETAKPEASSASSEEGEEDVNQGEDDGDEEGESDDNEDEEEEEAELEEGSKRDERDAEDYNSFGDSDESSLGDEYDL
eukprot:gb/GECG01001028.1/.p1 GENE.gb/GECG01001028.1/~~gb/GECG01001028.1/.p1  ORF type:complete len:369 (+),score=79.09 gb/GECG01001028.1/:1-1107(+)